MAYSYNKYTGTGASQILAVPPYIDRTHIKVSINNVDSTSFSWVNNSAISLTALLGSVVKVYRTSSPGARLTDYIDGVPLTEVALDNDSLQSFYLSQEQLDSTQDALAVLGQPNFTAIVDGVNTNAALAAASAVTATTQAGIATTAAGTAATQAGVATTQAGTATTQAGIATTAAGTATGAASTATTQAGIATTAAGTATTQAGLAASSASDANTSALAAAASAAAAITVPTGSVFYFAATAPPVGYLKANGATIGSASSGATARANADTATLYALLWGSWSQANLPIQTSTGSASTRGASAAADFAANKRLPLPELRGEFIRAWDDSRGIDASRAFGSFVGDAIRNITGSVGSFFRFLTPVGVGALSVTVASSTPPVAGTAGTNAGDTANVAFDASLQVPTASENRPRSVALLACIKY